MPSFPGPPEFDSTPTHSLDRGDPDNLSRLGFGSPAGTHVVPPRHFLCDGASADRTERDVLHGPGPDVGLAGAASEVGPGPYPLECLLLRLRAGEGGPARAVLRTG
jgi:kynurenine formamidase